jgi:hypothetical protein
MKLEGQHRKNEAARWRNNKYLEISFTFLFLTPIVAQDLVARGSVPAFKNGYHAAIRIYVEKDSH